MTRNLLQLFKALAVPILAVVFLRVTGLMSGVSYVAQTAMVEAGFSNASDEKLRRPEPFDFNFVVKDQHGNRIPFQDFKGKVIFLNLWATWCGPCRAEMPTIQSLYSQSLGDSVVFVMLSVDEGDAEPKVSRYIKGNNFTFPVFRPSGYLTNQLNVPVIPTTFIISKAGGIVGKEEGATNFDTPRFRKFLKKLSKE